jgi:hypothetical protein
MIYQLTPEQLATIQSGITHLSSGNALPVENSIVIPPVLPEQFIFQSGGLNAATEPPPVYPEIKPLIASPDLRQPSIVQAPITINQQGRDEILYHISQLAKISPENVTVVDVIHEAVNESVTKAQIIEVTKNISETPSLNVNPVTLIEVFKEDAPAVAEAIKNGEPLSEPVTAAILENNIVTIVGEKQPIAPVVLIPVSYPVENIPVTQTTQPVIKNKKGLLDRLTNYVYRFLFNK